MIAAADRDDVIWLSGILEGEGCFDLQARRYPRVRLSMTDRDVVGRVATLFGSTIRLTLKGGAKPTWHAERQGPAAVEIMRAVLPYMGSRRSQKIAEILSHVAWASGEMTAPKAYGYPLTRPPGLLSPKEVTADARS